MKKPYYIIKFSAVECRFEIRVNDHPVLTMNVENGQISSQIPINHAISESGMTEISVSIVPVIGSTQFSNDTKFEYTCNLYTIESGFKFVEAYERYQSPKVHDNQPLSFFANTQNLDVTVNYKLNTLWEQGNDLKDIEDFEIKLRSAYIEIANTIKNKQFKVFEDRIKNREQNIATSMYLSSVDSNARIRGLIQDFENGFDIVNLAEDSIIIYAADGKKASLKRPTGEPALSFEKAEPKEFLMLDLEFYFNKDTGRLEII
ncbi:hypothetical protein [Aquimarina sp. RZ0]|uniref:hypothetical protein n=1 Tax=Aquimarina sp. RZ0 TaxID=2607730 RepID=UPI0011F136A1|nr:hypothetical protein [Aquimarina sp. RZ0]KAA1245318.1 hypothetical protein F0000_12415 [Aquimarina sp. RZ0]